MQNKADSSDEKNEKIPSNPIVETRIEPRGEVVVERHDAPPKGPADKRIHPRRRLPSVPDRREETDDKEQTDK